MRRWIALFLTGLLVAAVPAYAASEAVPASVSAPEQPLTCTDSSAAGIAPPAVAPTAGLSGYHAAWFAQSGFPTLCPGHTAPVTIAFMNTGSLGWYAGSPGQSAFLGTWGPDPGQDRPTPLGGADVGWPSANRVAAQSSSYVGPGQVSWFQFTVRAPVRTGTYRLSLRPVIEGTQWIDDQDVSFYVTVKASDAIPVASPPASPATAAPRRATVARSYRPLVAADGSRSIRVNTLMYHYVSWLPPDPGVLRRDLTISPKDFEDHVRYLKENGYNTITAVDLWWSLDTGNPLPPKPVLLTFDDGYVDHHDVVLPILKAYGMVATFAVTANLVDRPGYMTRAMVRELADAGMDVESHGTDHVSVNRLGYASQVYQLCTSRRILSEWTGTDVRHFIYPSGDFLPVPGQALTACGYLTALRKDGGSVQSSNDMLSLRRTRVRGQQGLAALLLALQQ